MKCVQMICNAGGNVGSVNVHGILIEYESIAGKPKVICLLGMKKSKISTKCTYNISLLICIMISCDIIVCD